MAQEGNQPLVPIPIPEPPSPALPRKLKRFRSESNASTTPATTPTTPPFVTPTTPPNTIENAVEPLTNDPTDSSTPTDKPNSAPGSTPNETYATSDLPLEGSNLDSPASSTPITTRRILKIPKSAKASDEAQKKEVTSVTTPPKVPVAIQLLPGTLRPDGTLRKEVKVRAGTLPKNIFLSDLSPDKKQPKQVRAKKVGQSKRIRPNASFLTRLVQSSERHNSNLANMEDEPNYEILDSGEDTNESSGVDNEGSDGEEGEEEGGGEGGELERENGGGEYGNDEEAALSDGIKDKTMNMLATAQRSVKNERRYIMQQITAMRKMEGISLIKDLAKMYNLHVLIPEEEELMRKSLLSGGKRSRLLHPSPTKSSRTSLSSSTTSSSSSSSASRLVKSVGRIGFNCD